MLLGKPAIGSTSLREPRIALGCVQHCVVIRGHGRLGDGLHGNDSALDTLGEIVKPGGEACRAGRLASVDEAGHRVHGRDDLLGRIAVLAGDLERLPEATRSMLETLLADSAAVNPNSSRTPAVLAVLGSARQCSVVLGGTRRCSAVRKPLSTTLPSGRRSCLLPFYAARSVPAGW